MPSSWAVNAEKTIYLFPNKLNRNILRKIIEDCEEPKSTIHFVEYEAVYKKTVFSLLEAERLIKKALLTSNIESSENSDSDNDKLQDRTGQETPYSSRKLACGKFEFLLKFTLYKNFYCFQDR